MAGKNKKNKDLKKEKINLVFDPLARREFLTGFHKRKLQRKEKFKEDLKNMMKEERRKIREDAKGTYKKLVVSHRSCPEVEHLLNEEHDLGSHSVEIKELSTNELAKENNWIGANQASYGGDDDEEEEEEDVKEEEESDPECVPGMDLVEKPAKAKKEQLESSDSKSKKTDSKPLKIDREFRSAKEIKKVIRKQSSKIVKKSKAYQMKNKIDKLDSRKKSRMANKRVANIKEQSKKGRRFKKNEERKARLESRKNRDNNVVKPKKRKF